MCSPCCGPCYPLKCCKSRELRSSILITRCDCVLRNGLQTDCPRTECRCDCQCLTKPNLCCCPSRYEWRFRCKTMGKKSYAGQEQLKLHHPSPSILCGQCNPCCLPYF